MEKSKMKKGKKIFLTIIITILIIIFAVAGVFYYIFSAGKNYIDESFNEQINIILPKSETFKVTSTAKGDDQSKIARLNNSVFTFYLDNSACSDPTARGNDKIMQLIEIKEDGTYNIFDSIPVWMHGNVLTDKEEQLIYYTTYEEEYDNGQYYPAVKIYTYSYGEEIERINEYAISDERTNAFEANPRVGADIDEDGNIAVAFGNYSGIMFVYVYDKEHNKWIKHPIEHYLDTYMGDSNLYPYVRLKGINCIKVVASRDTTNIEGGGLYDNPLRNYTRYFSYDGSQWTHSIIADARDKDNLDIEVKPLELFIDDALNTHIIIQENTKLHYYLINAAGEKSEIDLINFKNETAITFVRIIQLNNKKYYAVSGIAVKGFKQTGYVEIYDYDTKKLKYRNNSVCNSPYLYVNKQSETDVIDMMIISRDKNYKENSETHFISLKLN
jgi:hypothetical protein